MSQFRKSLIQFVANGIFWGWNLSFLAIVYLGILPFVGIALFAAGLTGEIPWGFQLTMVALIVIPIVATVIGAQRFQQDPVALLRWFYGVEAPLFLLILLRLFLLRELPLASAYVLTTIVLAILTFGLNCLTVPQERGPVWEWIQLTCNSFVILVGLYAGSVLVFYVPPTLVEFLRFLGELTQFIFSGDWLEWFFRPGDLVLVALILTLFCLTTLVFMAMPIAMVSLYLQSGWQQLKQFASRYSWPWTAIGSVLVITLWTTLLMGLSPQPQVLAFQLLEDPNISRLEQLSQADTIRDGLVNAYLHRYRYLSPDEDNNHVAAMYWDTFRLPEPVLNGLQDLYNSLLSPFLYDGTNTDSQTAAEFYADFFDVAIQKAEQDPVQKALRSTYNRDQVNAGLLNINQGVVWLAQQDIQVIPQGDWAEIEIHEVYHNRTADNQEIFYAFSMPESAVLTGLWLGDTDNRALRFPYVVSPRGAAQEVYNDQVRQRVDPALLEQVGPRNYRLRAFPIPGRQPLSTDRPEMHLWLTYKVMQHSGSWPLPHLSERRNIFWNRRTRRTVNGHTGSSHTSDWLPPYLDAAEDRAPQSHWFELPTGETISAQPLDPADLKLPESKRIALVLDGSYSMSRHLGSLNENVHWLNELILPRNTVDLYLTDADPLQAQRVHDVPHVDLDPIVFYGSLSLREIVDQFAALHGSRDYDAVLVLTDPGSYDLETDREVSYVPNAPLWLAHLDGLPGAYEDSLLEAVQDSGGGVALGVQEALQRFSTESTLGSQVINVMDGYAWFRNAPVSGVPEDPEFAEIAARQWIEALSRDSGEKTLAELDDIHAVAKEFGLVTPYSSMIVLVNEAQREALKQAEARADRFDREVETGIEGLTSPDSPFVTAVPEPHEWILIGLASAGLSLLAWRRYRQTKLP